MLQSPTLPATWRGLLEMFRPAFRRSRTFGLFALLATGLVAQTARRTVVGMLVGAGWLRWCRFTRAAGSSRITAGTWIGSGWCWPG